jgi:hypothetical protein
VSALAVASTCFTSKILASGSDASRQGVLANLSASDIALIERSDSMPTFSSVRGLVAFCMSSNSCPIEAVIKTAHADLTVAYCVHL